MIRELEELGVSYGYDGMSTTAKSMVFTRRITVEDTEEIDIVIVRVPRPPIIFEEVWMENLRRNLEETALRQDGMLYLPGEFPTKEAEYLLQNRLMEQLEHFFPPVTVNREPPVSNEEMRELLGKVQARSEAA